MVWLPGGKQASALTVLVATALACAAPGTANLPGARAGRQAWASAAARRAATHTAASLVGTPFRAGGASRTGFDCSGPVVYSYAQAGATGVPHSAALLERVATPVPLQGLQPGDLLFFRLGGRKTTHVALYLGSRSFVHAPSSDKRVERVSFDDVYWGRRLGRAGRLGQ